MQWLNVSTCPACESSSKIFVGKLQGSAYKFGGETILFPTNGIPLVKCSECTLIYKTVIPSPNFLIEVSTRPSAKVWVNKYDFFYEVSLLKKLANSEKFDLLDAGAASGELLKACINIKGRKSALDIIKYSEIDIYNNGEFIQDVLDSPDLKWSQIPYDIVTLFDVIEHLYRPNYAFKNINSLVKNGGFVVVETGNTESYWSQSFGVNHWNYTRLFEHHIFWSKYSLEQIAQKYGFQVIYWSKKRHKSSLDTSPKKKLQAFVKSELYRHYQRGYYQLALLFGKSGFQPGNPFTKDHFQAVLKKTSD